jgi:hypothetical protein
LPAANGNGTATLPAGTSVYIPVLALHHDPTYFPEPEKFDPDRFTEESKRSRPKYTYIPFGEGPRMCLGKGSHLIAPCMSFWFQSTYDVILRSMCQEGLCMVDRQIHLLLDKRTLSCEFRQLAGPVETVAFKEVQNMFYF